MKVSLHPAQAVTKPCLSKAGPREIFPRDLDDMRLQPADPTFSLSPVQLFPIERLAGGGTPGLRHVHLRFPPAQVLRVVSPRGRVGPIIVTLRACRAWVR